MKITITGSLGNISKPLVKELVQKGHQVTVISSNPDKQKDIEALGAKAAIGSIEDVTFLTNLFKNADAAYCMEPPVSFFDHHVDMYEHYLKIGNAYAEAIRQSGIRQIVHLSSIGAHTDKGVGMLTIHHQVESVLNQLPSNVNIVFMRPVGFYYNLLGFINTIKTQGAIITNYSGDIREPWASPVDIASAIAEEITTPFAGRKIRYVASDELTGNEVAGILGTAIGKPDVKWIAVPDEQLLQGLIAAGMNPGIAKGYVEMNASRQEGSLYEDYHRNRPALSKTKLKDFAKEFAAAYNQR